MSLGETTALGAAPRVLRERESERSAMSIAEPSSLLDLAKTHVGGDQHKIEKEDNGNAPRRILGDISNLMQKPNQLAGTQKMQQSSSITKDNIDQLKKDNVALQKLIAERTKLDYLRGIDMQKLQLQNLQLAQANSQIVKELNLAKDRLKIMQHEFGCKNVIIAAQRMELKKKKNATACPIVVNEVGVTNGDEIANKPSDANRVECQPHLDGKLRSKSLGSAAAQKVNRTEKPKSKRVSMRRQSATLASEETEDPFEICDGDAKMPICSLPDESSDNKKHVVQECNNIATSDDDTEESRRSSLARPSRAAAMKVQSYKEIPLNKKMRRES